MVLLLTFMFISDGRAKNPTSRTIQWLPNRVTDSTAYKHFSTFDDTYDHVLPGSRKQCTHSVAYPPRRDPKGA